jgi:multidrug efflux pump subunit AcrA (membrane-fusion protein)
VKRLEQLTDFKQIRAPFDGVITARGVDAGALVGTGTGAKELFHLASTSRLRVFINVPQQYTPATKTGLAAYLTLPELPGKRFEGKVGAHVAVNRGELADAARGDRRGQPHRRAAAGSYVQAHFLLSESRRTVRLPANALLFRTDGAQVATVDHDGRVHLQERVDPARSGRGARARRRPDRRGTGRGEPAGLHCRRPGGSRRVCTRRGSTEMTRAVAVVASLVALAVPLAGQTAGAAANEADA